MRISDWSSDVCSSDLAKATGDTSERSSLAVQYNALLSQINGLANDASFNGTNLIQATPDDLEVVFNEDGTSDLTITGLDSTNGTGGLNIGIATNKDRKSTRLNSSH